jgi:hypothetical protein
MTARARRREEGRCADPIEVFTARCEARAILFEAGEFDLQSAVDVLQTAAESTGLVTLLGQDRVQGLMARAFAPIRIEAIESEAPASPANEPYHLVSRDGVASAAELQRAYDRAIAERFRHRLPASTVDALLYVIPQKEPARLRQFIAGRTAHELRLMRVQVNAEMG